ncbi:MAG: O-antigen ligase family protein [Aurantibacter sp.]
MKWLISLSFISRIGLAMALSLLLNLGMGVFLKNRLSQKEYTLMAEVDYDVQGTMELHFDAGNNFNRTQEVVQDVANGTNSLEFLFELNEEEQLKFLRLDFGNDRQLSEVRLKSLSLSTENEVLFDLNEKQIANQISLVQGVTQIEKTASFRPDASRQPFDPYLVFSPVNELISPLWQRTMLLVAPWVLLLFFPLVTWAKTRFEKKEFALLLATLFLASIPLKIAWVTFTSLLLLGYALVELARTRGLKFDQGHLAILSLFAVPLLFLGQGELSKLTIPLGFVLFPIICSMVDFSDYQDDIKKAFARVFFVLMSITVVSWVLLMCYGGYFNSLDLSNYFTDIKSNVHLVMSWLYYGHPTFLSFFILIGGIFCYDLFKRQKITKTYGLVYAGLMIGTLLILGSRFAWVLVIFLPMLMAIPVKYLKTVLVPLWAALFAGTVYFIDKLDLLRAELWQISFTEIKKNLWLGHGTGNSDAVLPDQLAIERKGPDAIIEINHSHNQFLTYLLENGLLGTLLFTALMLFIYFRFAKCDNKVMMLVTFAILLLMVVESPLRTATPLYLFSFLLCLFMNHDKNRNLADNL